ncbi:cytochrome c oxidase subunit 3 [Arboricoccus pini]|uniref:Cytochrome c oxidase subunit 3 n=1 Tax=Arboricoccus pini TaxID=1963835 RepID=A0A212QZD9_9PROT|nr:cytochrome c oxidase subunit 3 [Arboricoccus pini]SNB65112.1 cytochrome c oxidase subunit 3 [Arboricoccus pini]
MAGSAEVLTGANAGHDVPHHDYHLLKPSPWPFVGSLSAGAMLLGAALWMHKGAVGPYLAVIGLLGVLFTMFGWWRDVLRESAAGDHKPVVNRGLRLGMALFITSEVLLFFAFFWAFFHSALEPPTAATAAWPPAGVEPLSPWQIPLLNTLILLLSGVTVTWAHHAVKEGHNRVAFKALLITCVLGAIFTCFQLYEYSHALHEGLTPQAGTFGSTFYIATGFHGFHVFVGTVFLLVCMFRAYALAFSPQKHVGFEAAAWYWHFVDVVWLFLFVCIYVWGGSVSWSVTGP